MTLTRIALASLPALALALPAPGAQAQARVRQPAPDLEHRFELVAADGRQTGLLWGRRAPDEVCASPDGPQTGVCWVVPFPPEWCGETVLAVAVAPDGRRSEPGNTREDYWPCSCVDLTGDGTVGGPDFGRWLLAGFGGGGAWFGAWRRYLGATCPLTE